MKEKLTEISVLIVVGICIVWAAIMMNINDKTNFNAINITDLDNKYDTVLMYLKYDYAKSRKRDSLNRLFRAKAFYIDKEEVGIDSRGYFYSLHHREYKIKKQ